MKEGQASTTAEECAAVRAVESLRPEHQRVCYDPLARHFLTMKYRLVGKSPSLARAALWLLGERRFPGAAGWVVVRTRYIDDYLRECIGAGTQQLVILGAGYDSRAYRIEDLKGKVKVFEVDHPATQKVKLERLKKMLGTLPDHVVYVPIDFNKQKLDRRLFESGYDRFLKTLFIWEGVTSFLTAEAVDETLAFVVNNSGQGSSIIFDYVYRSILDGTSDLEVGRRIVEQERKIGEPNIFGIGEGAVGDFLSKRGFHEITDSTADSLRRVYFAGANRNRKVASYEGIVHATVKPRA